MSKSLFKKMRRPFFYFLVVLCGSWEVLLFFIRQRIFRRSLPNFQAVDEKVLMRGGQPTLSGLSELIRQGIKTVINLRQCRRFPKKRMRRALGGQARVFHLPFSPYRLSDQIVIRFLKILCDPEHQPAYVHCFHGMDRTGALCAIYRIICQNWEKEHAIAEMKSRGLHWWHNNLVEYIRELDVDLIRTQIDS